MKSILVRHVRSYVVVWSLRESSRISRINILLMTKQWVRLLHKEGLGVVCMLGFLRKIVKTSK